jgi:hypothetical protein
MITRNILAAAALAGTLAVAAPAAFAQNQPIVGISTVTTYSIDATITAVDTAKRTITFTGPAGRTLTRNVGQGVNMTTSKVGDVVSIAFEDKLSFVVSGPNVKTPGDRELNVTAMAGGNRGAAGVMADQAVANWYVTSVDAAGGKVSIVNPAGGEVRTYNVITAEGRAQLPRIKPGDKLTAIDSQVLVVAVGPKK